MTLKRQAGTGALIAALEDAWRAIQRHHPDVPAAQVIVGQGSGHGRGLLLGHLAPERWQPAGQPDALIHELLIAGEGLALGADDVFTTELHEAVHALAVARAHRGHQPRRPLPQRVDFKDARRGARPRRHPRPDAGLE